MTRQIVYTDPRHALVMMHDHGVRITFDGEEYDQDELIALAQDFGWQVTVNVHPDSLTLYEPREGDVLADVANSPLKQAYGFARYFTFSPMHVETGVSVAGCAIIQRDGKAWIGGERNAAEVG